MERQFSKVLVLASRLALGVVFITGIGSAVRADGQNADVSEVGLGSLPNLNLDTQSRMVSPENPTGGKGMGALAAPSPYLPFSESASQLGPGWKVRPFIKLAPHSTTTIMDISGPGIIEHIWMAAMPSFQGYGRAIVLRFYWDNERNPSIEVPLPDFFAIGHDRFSPVNSLSVIDVPTASMNCYWPMPFRMHARITVTNDSDKPLPLFTYQIDYRLGAVSRDAGYFHAEWRKATVKRSDAVYTILDEVKGRGRYVGTFLSWTQMSTGWFGEGEVKFYIDDDTKHPTIVGTGTEDYFGADYGFPALYSTVYVGNVLNPKNPDPSGGPPQYSLYRWHIMDPITFHNNLKVTIQDLGWYPTGKYQPLGDTIASVAYWYQAEPHNAFPPFLPLDKRWPQ